MAAAAFVAELIKFVKDDLLELWRQLNYDNIACLPRLPLATVQYIN